MLQRFLEMFLFNSCGWDLTLKAIKVKTQCHIFNSWKSTLCLFLKRLSKYGALKAVDIGRGIIIWTEVDMLHCHCVRKYTENDTF